MKRISLLLFFFSIYIVVAFANIQVNKNENNIQSKGLNSNQTESLMEQQNLELKYNVKRGNRLPVDINKIPSNAYEQGIVIIKIQPYMHQELDAEFFTPEKENYVKTGIAALDEVNQELEVVEYKRALDALYRISPASEKHKERHQAWGAHLWREVKFNKNIDVIEAVKMFQALDEIAIAEPKYTIKHIEPVETKPLNYDKRDKWTPNDPFYSANQWHFNNTGQDIGQVGTPGWDCNAEAAWEIEKGNQSFIVAIIDQGVQYDHPDIEANMWPGIGPEGTSTAPGSHGTHVAGTVSAVTNNNVGVAGLAGGDGSGNGAKIMSIDLWGSSGLTNLGMNIYAADNGASITQNSWGYEYSGYYSQNALDGIDYFNTHGGGNGLVGGITIFAAGNDNDDGDWYPAYYGYNDDNVMGAMAVASHDNKGQKSSFSNFGPWVDITAPGTNVASTDVTSDYSFKSGTSMACPHVSGVAALIVSNTQGVLTNEELWDILVNSVRVDIYDVNPGYTGQLGIGALDAAAALEEAQTYLGGVPNPDNFVATAVSTTQINLTWDLNEFNDNILIAYAPAGNEIGTPVNGQTYTVGESIPGGGTVIYLGVGSSYNHFDLEQDAAYTYMAWSIAAEDRQDEFGEWYQEGDYSSGKGSAVSTFSGWVHWDDNNNGGSVGSGTARVYSIASRWEPSDIAAYDGFEITKIRAFVNDAATSATVKIWQGPDSENLTEYVSQDFTQVAGSWNEVELTNTYFIDASMELWFGVEYDDPGDGVYPLGRDAGPQVPGKGNMILWDGSWVELTDLNNALTYNWNLQAFVEMSSEPLFTLELIANPETGGSPSGGGNYAEGASVQINANTADGYNFINWTISDDIISELETFTYTMPASNVTITANYEEVVVPEYSLALVANPDEGGNPSGDGNYQEGTEVLISANPEVGFDFVNWTIGGDEISSNEDFYYTMPGQNITIVANYEETTTAVTNFDITDYSLNVFPNPNNGIFDVELILPVETNIEIQIFDVLGRRVFGLPSQTLSNGKNNIKINQSSLLNKGFYILRINAYNINNNLLVFRKDLKILVE